MKLIVFERTDEGVEFRIHNVEPDGLPLVFPNATNKHLCWFLTSVDGNNVIAAGGDVTIAGYSSNHTPQKNPSISTT